MWHELELSFFVQDLHPSFFFLCLCCHIIKINEKMEKGKCFEQRYGYSNSQLQTYFLMQTSIFNRHNKKFPPLHFDTIVISWGHTSISRAYAIRLLMHRWLYFWCSIQELENIVFFLTYFILVLFSLTLHQYSVKNSPVKISTNININKMYINRNWRTFFIECVKKYDIQEYCFL